MANTLLAVLGVGALVFLANRIAFFLRRLQEVRHSGIPFSVIPWQPFGRVTQLTHPIWFPVFNALPDRVKGNWFMFMTEGLLWDKLYQGLFHRVGSDVYMTLTLSGGISVWIADAGLIVQIMNRRNDFPKPLEMYKILDIYGKNVLSVEGHTWRKHRRVVGPPFTEKNNHLVWTESLYQAQAMLDSVVGEDGRSSRTIQDLEPIVSYLALTIISKAGYGVRLGWKDKAGKVKYLEEDKTSDPALGPEWVEGKTHNHTMSFGDALYHVSKDIIWLILLPQSVLRRLPIKSAKRAAQAYGNWGNYMREMIAAKRRAMDSLEDGKQSNDLLANLVKSARETSNLVGDERSALLAAGKDSKSKSEASSFSDDEILGNAFLLIIAGHETSAGALQHSMLMLATNVRSQRALQRDIDRIFGGAPPSTWDYERDFPRVFGGMPGAMLAEVLRLIPPALAPPKCSPASQSVTIHGKPATLPAGSDLIVGIAAVQRNAKYWPHGKPNPKAIEYAGLSGSNPDDDLGQFKPERWMLKDDGAKTGANGSANGSAHGKMNGSAAVAGGGSSSSSSRSTRMPEATKTADSETLGINNAADTAEDLLKPPKGAYLPFSDGYRACLGRRFAQVEVMAIMSVIFQAYSVELAVDEWASDEEVAAMSEEEKRAVWTKAKEATRDRFRDGMRSIITHKMVKDPVPVRLVRRGEERFAAEDW